MQIKDVYKVQISGVNLLIIPLAVSLLAFF